MIDEREQLVLEQLINFSREIGDILDQDSNFKKFVTVFLLAYASVLLYVAIMEIPLRPIYNDKYRPMNMK